MMPSIIPNPIPRFRGSADLVSRKSRSVPPAFLAAAFALLLALPTAGAAGAEPAADLTADLAKAEAGDAYAALRVGRAYNDGRGVAEDHDAADAWLRRAAEGGASEAYNDLGDMALHGGLGGEPGGVEDALTFYLRAAQAGSNQRLERIGDLYARIEVSTGPGSRAFLYWSRAASHYEMKIAEGADWEAVRLARLLRDGRGVPRDPDRAVALYHLAADRGVALALVDLGDLYYDGRAMPRDPALAFAYYRQAAAAGIGARLERIGDMQHDGLGTGADPAAAAETWRAAIAYYQGRAEQDGWSAIALGRMYRDGKGVPPDADEARRYFELADRLGVARARAAMGDLAGDPADDPGAVP
jgi:TPR repeat protein